MSATVVVENLCVVSVSGSQSPFILSTGGTGTAVGTGTVQPVTGRSTHDQRTKALGNLVDGDTTD
jgi:hypothetical protein